ncbi:MAG: Gfo/Idh/MocA family oxidoreductase, partial [Actinomycetota bacterium]
MGRAPGDLETGQPEVREALRGGRLLRRLRVGIVGCGWVARHRHVPAYRRSGTADIVAVYDRRPERARELGSRIRATPYSGELDEMLAKERLDVVSICTPPWLHAPQSQTALEAGVNVFVEKPMAMTEAECRAMCDAASRHGRALCVSHNFLFSRAVSEAYRRVASGRAGRIESLLGFQMS